MDNAIRDGRGWRQSLLLPPLMAVALALLLSSCARSEPEAALRARVASLVEAMAQPDPAAMQQHLAADFIGNDGLDRDGARRLAMGFALRHRDIGISLGPLDVDLSGEHAAVRGTAILRGGSGSGLPESAQVYEVESGWRLEDGDWMLASVRWSPAL